MHVSARFCVARLGLLFALPSLGACGGGSTPEDAGARDAGGSPFDAGGDAAGWLDGGVSCAPSPLVFPDEWRACDTDADCTIAFDADRVCDDYWVLGVAAASRLDLEAAVRACQGVTPPPGDCMGLPFGNTDDGYRSRSAWFSVSCDGVPGSAARRCASHAHAAGRACESHDECPGDTLCVSDPCSSPPCPGNGVNPACRICGSSPPCHCGYWGTAGGGYQRCESDPDCVGAYCGGGGPEDPCTAPCIHGFCAPEAGDDTLPFCGT